MSVQVNNIANNDNVKRLSGKIRESVCIHLKANAAGKVGDGLTMNCFHCQKHVASNTY